MKGLRPASARARARPIRAPAPISDRGSLSSVLGQKHQRFRRAETRLDGGHAASKQEKYRRKNLRHR
jgi:hypothetical protein